MSPIVRSGLSAAVLVSLFGCGGGDEVEVGTVSGVVTLDGEPLRGVFVTFQPTGFPPSQGVTDRDGKYQLQYVGQAGAVVGQHDVFLNEALEDELVDLAIDIGGDPSKVPAKFQEPFQTVEVKSGHNDVPLTLSSSE